MRKPTSVEEVETAMDPGPGGYEPDTAVHILRDEVKRLRAELDEIVNRATRHKRATDLKKYLLWDLQYIEDRVNAALKGIEFTRYLLHKQDYTE